MERVQSPPRLHRPDGAVRRVGVEIEFAGPTIERAAELVRDLYGGTIEPKNRFSIAVTGTRFGEFAVEIDSTVLKEQRWEKRLEELGLTTHYLVAVDDALESLARAWIPCEIAAPPVAIDRLHELEALRVGLHAMGAKGTRASPLYAFGFQLNPELPADDAETILRHLQSFVVLYDWIVETACIDGTRKLTSFIDPYPIEWRRRLLSHRQAPSLEALIEEYVLFNPTRNRALDMLPAFAWLRKDLVFPHAREPTQIHPRPTFHYRLPNSCIDEASWSFAAEWNRWLLVERVAHDAPRLTRLCAECLARLEGDRARWIDRVAREVAST